VYVASVNVCLVPAYPFSVVVTVVCVGPAHRFAAQSRIDKGARRAAPNMSESPEMAVGMGKELAEKRAGNREAPEDRDQPAGSDRRFVTGHNAASPRIQSLIGNK
jgi:hypothetical protein